MKKLIWFLLILMMPVVLADVTIYKHDFTVIMEDGFWQNDCTQTTEGTGYIDCNTASGGAEEHLFLNSIAPSNPSGIFLFPNNTNEQWYMEVNYSVPTLGAGTNPAMNFMSDTSTSIDIAPNDLWLWAIVESPGTLEERDVDACSPATPMQTDHIVPGQNPRMLNFSYNVTSNNVSLYALNDDNNMNFNGSIVLNCLSVRLPFKTISFGDSRTPGGVHGRRNISFIKIVNITSQTDEVVPEITLINVTSEGDLGQIVYNGSPEELGNFTGAAATNDTTLSIFAKTNEFAYCAMVSNNIDLNYTGLLEYNPNSKCSTSGSTSHVCTVTEDNKTLTPGINNFTLGCQDINNNERNQKFTVNLTIEETNTTLFLDGINNSRKYEFKTLANITADCNTSVECEVCISLDAPNTGKNISCGLNTTHYDFNISVLRVSNFTTGPAEMTLSNPNGSVHIKSDNQTLIQDVLLNVTSSGVSNNINITYEGQRVTIPGDLDSIYLKNTRFSSGGITVDAVNLTYTEKGSKFIIIDLTNIQNFINLTFDLTGGDLDANNEFIYVENFTGIDGASQFNDSLSFNIDAPLGVFDEYTNNNSFWAVELLTGAERPNLNYDTSGMLFYGQTATKGAGSSSSDLEYTDSGQADFRNTSRVEHSYHYSLAYGQCQNPQTSGSRSASLVIQATDGTSNVDLVTYAISSGGADPDSQGAYQNLTLIKTGQDTYLATVNGSSEGNKDLSSLDSNQQIKIRHLIGVSDFCDGSGGSTATASILLDETRFSGAWLNRSTNNGTYKQSGNITSSTIQETINNVSRITLNKKDFNTGDTGITYYISNTCNSTEPTFEQTTPGSLHVFESTGNQICWRASLNSTSNVSSPIIKEVSLEVVRGTPENVTVDYGDDGNIEVTHNGKLNSTIGPLNVNITPFGTGEVLIKISSATAGQIQVDNFLFNSSFNPVSFNTSRFEDCETCKIEFNFSGDDITVDGLEWDFFGSHNYTVTAKANDIEDSRKVQVYYSDFNTSLPTDVEFWDVSAQNQTQFNVTPFAQNNRTPIWNLTNHAYDEPIAIYVKTNATIPCINITYSNTSLKEDGFVLNTSYQNILSNISVNSSAIGGTGEGIWNFIDLVGCSNVFEIPWFFFAAICVDCFFDETQLDNYNIIIE